MPPEIVILGPPVDKDRQLAIGIFSYTPPSGAATMLCDECEQRLWVGVKQQAALAAGGTGVKVWCFNCYVELSQPGDKIAHLGGVSGKIKTHDTP
jgi:hypothetical protein